MICVHNVVYALLHIRYIFQDEIRRVSGLNQSGNFKEQSSSGVTKAPSCPGHAESLVIPKFRIISLIPNKIRIPKPIRESLQRKDFCIKTSG